MSLIIACTTEKGGAAKSSLAIALGSGLHRQGVKVVIVDADPQGTTRQWRDCAKEDADLPPVVALDRPEVFASGVKSLAADVIIVDTPARADKLAASVIRAAHVALIPMQPSPADLWACAPTVDLINAKRDIGGKIEAGFVPTRTQSGRKLTKEVLAGDWNEYGLPILNSHIADRSTHPQAMAQGCSIYDMKDKRAAADVDALIEELRELKWLEC